MARTLEDPTPDAVLDAMTPCEPYTALDLAVEFGGQDKRRTLQRRLERLHEDDQIRKKHHEGGANRVSWWREP